MNIRESKVSTGVAISEPFVVEAEQVQDGGLSVVVAAAERFWPPSAMAPAPNKLVFTKSLLEFMVYPLGRENYGEFFRIRLQSHFRIAYCTR